MPHTQIKWCPPPHTPPTHRSSASLSVPTLLPGPRPGESGPPTSALLAITAARWRSDTAGTHAAGGGGCRGGREGAAGKK